jgi:phosphoribosylglycinamide formyltransferase-1
MANPRVAVLASGEGTTAEAVAKAWVKDPDAPRIELIITNNPDAGIIKRFAEVESVIIADEAEILKRLDQADFDLIWLAGYMKKVGPKLVERFGWRDEYNSPFQAMMLNTHPGLLPATKGLHGLHVQEFVLKNPEQPAGHTLHVVSTEFDEGPTVTQHTVEVKPDDTPQSLFDRVRISEKKHLPDDIEHFLSDRKNFIDGR